MRKPDENPGLMRDMHEDLVFDQTVMAAWGLVGWAVCSNMNRDLWYWHA